MTRTLTRILPALALLLLLVGAQPTTAQTHSFGLDSDAAFLAWAADNDWAKQFGANMKWGNNASNGDWEWALVNGSDYPFVQDNKVWNGGTYEFSFTWDPFGASLALDGESISADVGGSGITHILARASKYEQNQWSGFNWFDISLLSTGESIFNNSLAADANAEYWAIQDLRLADGFVISGEITLDGTGRTAGARPMAQFKVGTATTVTPEPETWFLLATGLGVLGIVSWRRRGTEQA